MTATCALGSLWPSLAGGALIGTAAALLWILNGRIAGVSGIAGGLLRGRPGDRSWRALFLGGLLIGGLAVGWAFPSALGPTSASMPTVLLAGLLVGVGTTLANGCTSGHGVCGVSRLSPRSLIATATFMGLGFITVYLVEHVLGGGP